MQVLVKNPLVDVKAPSGVEESFWSETCYYPTQAFSMTSLIQESDPVGLSPWLFVEDKVSFFLENLSPCQNLWVKNLSSLQSLLAHFNSGGMILNASTSQVTEEYLPMGKRNITSQEQDFEQVVVWGEDKIDLSLWDTLPKGGFYLLGNLNGSLEVNLPNGSFEAFGRLWPLGEATEFGWRWENLEILKLKKI